MEKGLITRARKKDNEAIAEIIQLTERKAYFIAYKVVNNEATAKDIVQEAYIQAFQKLDQLSDDSKFESWFNQIVSHKALDYAKSKQGKNKPVEFSSLDDEEDRLEFEANIKNDKASFEPEASVNYKELQEGVQGVLSELPENQRLALMMYYFEDMSVSEIADVYGVSGNTVKGYLAYGRKKIKNIIEAMREKGVSFYGVAPMPFLTWMLHDQMAKTAVSHVSKDIIIKTVGTSAAATTAGAAATKTGATKSGFAKWWASKTASVKAGVCAGTVVVTGAVGYAAVDYNSNYNQVVRAVDKLDSLESFHIKGTETSPDGTSYVYDIYIKNTDDKEEYYSLYTNSYPDYEGYTLVSHFKKDKCQYYETQDPVDLNSIDTNKFGDYTKASLDGDTIVNSYIYQGKTNYRELSTLRVDAYDFETLKVYSELDNKPADFRLNIVNKLQKIDEKKMNEVSLKKEKDIKILEYNMALWRKLESGEVEIKEKSDYKCEMEIKNGYLISLEHYTPYNSDDGDMVYGISKMEFVDFVK